MKYAAKRGYTAPRIAAAYDRDRFSSWKGRLVDRLERKCMMGGVFRLTDGDSQHLVLDAPTGTGRLAQDLLACGFRVVALDVSEAMMMKGEEARHLRAHPHFLGYVCCDLEHLPFRRGSVDVVASLRVMGHLPPSVKAHALAEFHRIARLGAAVMFAADNMLLRVKRWLQYHLRLRGKPAMWFPLRHAGVCKLSAQSGLQITMRRDLLRFITESRLYVLRDRDD